jgi:hypothetical protein
LLAIIFLFLALGVCWKLGNTSKSTGTSSWLSVPLTDEEFEENFYYLAETDLDKVTEPGNAKEINLDDYKDEIIIDSAGDYILTGSFEGHVLIDAKEQNVHLYLNNVSIVSAGGPAIMVPDDSGDKLVITLVDGTENTISDNGDFRDYDEYEGAIDASCDITFNGAGTLTLNGYYKDAIHSKDIVKVLSGDYTIKCKRNAILANDGILVTDGTMKISSEKNGFQTAKSGEGGRGNLIITGGDFTIVAGRYSFVTTKADIYIYNCTVSNRSIVDTFNCGGVRRVQEGCVQ